MNNAAIDEKVAIAVHEIGAGETLPRILHLRVTERKPYFLYFIFIEKAVNNLNVSTKESHVLQTFLQSLSGTRPHTSTLNVHPDEVHLRIEFSKPNGIFTLSTSKFKHNGVCVFEIHFTPTALHLERNVRNNTIRILKHILITFHIGKLRQLSFSHIILILSAKVRNNS